MTDEKYERLFKYPRKKKNEGEGINMEDLTAPVDKKKNDQTQEEDTSLINAGKTDTERAKIKKKQQKSFFGSADNSKLNTTKIDMEAELDRDYERLSKP